MNQQTLLKGNVYKVLIKFAVPFMLANLLQVLYGAADLFVVGQFATTADASATSIGSQIMAMLTQMILGLTTGTTILLGQYFGGKKEKDMAKTVGTTIGLFIVLAIIISILLLWNKDSIIYVMNTPKQAIKPAGEYLVICSLGTVFIVAYNVVSGILRGLGDSKTPLLFVGIASVINIVLDIILVKYVHLGASGAAIATVTAQASSVIFSVLYIKKKGLGFSFGKNDLKFRVEFAKRILKTGAPIGLQNALVGISFLLITLVINKMGLVASVSVGVVEKLIEFLMLPSMAFGAAVAAMSAQNFGANELKRAKKCMFGGMIPSLLFSIVTVIVCQFWGETLTGIFTKNPDVIHEAAQYLRSYSFDCIMVAFVFNINGYFNGIGHSIFSMLHSMITTFGIRIPVTILLSKIANVTLFTMGIASPLSTLGSLLLCIAYFIWLERGKRRKCLILKN